MKEFIEMRDRDSGVVVRVYHIGLYNKVSYATIFNANTEKKAGCGWKTVKTSTLVPLDYDENN